MTGTPEKNDDRIAACQHKEHLEKKELISIWLKSLVALVLFFPAGIMIIKHSSARRQALQSPDEDAAEVLRLKVKFWFQTAIVGFVTVAILVLVVLIFLANERAIIRDFVNIELIKSSAPLILKGFGLNAKLFIVAEILMLVWALFIAVVRALPGKVASPVRWLSVVYIDTFRGLPVLLIMMIVVFGLRRTGLPILSGFSDFWLVVVAIVLAHGAYTADIIKGALDTVHPSQIAAARSLGLSYGQTLRYVVIPPAMWNISAPLLNGFISLQKETSLVSFVGLTDAINFATSLSIKNANLSAMTGAALCFLIITVPMTRIADKLTYRDRVRRRGVSK